MLRNWYIVFLFVICCNFIMFFSLVWIFILLDFVVIIVIKLVSNVIVIKNEEVLFDICKCKCVYLLKNMKVVIFYIC